MDWLDGTITVLLLLINMLSVLNIWLVLKVFFGCELRLTKRNLICAAGLFLIFDTGISFLFFPFGERFSQVQTALIFLFIAVGAFCLTEEKRFRTLLFSIPACLLYIHFNSVIQMLDTVFGLETVGIPYEEQLLTPFFCLSDLLLFGILMLVLSKSERQKWSLMLTIGEGVGIFVFILLVMALQLFFDQLEALYQNPFYKILGDGVLILLDVGFLYAIIHRKLAGYYRHVSQNYKEQFEEEYSYFQEYREQQQDTAQFRHDWKNHMLVLQKLLQDGSYSEAERYFGGLSGRMGLPRPKILSGNEMLDMLLCIKESECLEKNIIVSMEGRVADLSDWDPVDSSILFSNLLDNAIEANQRVAEGRFIRIRGRLVQESMYLEMQNPMQGELKQECGQIVTTKADAERHGLGLKQVAEILKKYQGEYQITTEGQIFAIRIQIPVGTPGT